MDDQGQASDRSRDNATLPTSKTATGSQDESLHYGGGMQPGGGMVEPDEFDKAVDEPDLPNDALAEGLSTGDRSGSRGSAASDDAAPARGTVDPVASPDSNVTGDRMGDPGGYLGSDRVVDTGVADAEPGGGDRSSST